VNDTSIIKALTAAKLPYHTFSGRLDMIQLEALSNVLGDIKYY
jgi:hypothetical protein